MELLEVWASNTLWNTASVFTTHTSCGEPTFFLPFAFITSKPAVSKCCDLMRGNLLDLMYKCARGSDSDEGNYTHICKLQSMSVSSCQVSVTQRSRHPLGFTASWWMFRGSKMGSSLIITIWPPRVPSFIQAKEWDVFCTDLCAAIDGRCGQSWALEYLGSGVGATLMVFHSPYKTTVQPALPLLPSDPDQHFAVPRTCLWPFLSSPILPPPLFSLITS